ncbi:phosphoglucosamine mutase [Legionella sp. W05-934-2]|jgi:phosphoglucosamine mutase|uniref:phosphoglucosamine mutase n=1 Tax=Legionella sp. W05-934-2 TaxID=1198649 RepID=UPI003462C410
MNIRQYFGTDGIRGHVGSDHINPEFVLKLGWAVGRVLANGDRKKVIIGKDTRISGYMFESALEAGLSAAGVDVRLLGPMPTPAIAYLTQTLRANAGIVISASHNPFEDNGIKFFTADGSKLDDDIELLIEAEINQPLKCVPSAKLGKVARINDAPGRYIEFCKSTIPSLTRLNGLKIVVDCANGATYHIAPNVFAELGADVVTIGDKPDGFNINQSCGSTNPEQLQQAVLQHGADVGIALDGDGDRCIMVNHAGEIVNGDQLLYIIACDRLHKNHLQGGIVGTVMSNFGLEKAFTQKQIPFKRAKVGDRYVMSMLKENNWKIGGEPSGHIACLDKTTTGDGIITALQVLAAMIKQQLSLIQLCKELTLLPQHLINLRTDHAQHLMQLPATQDALLRIENEIGSSGRVLLRPSGTEPLIRVMVEGQTMEQVQLYAETLANDIRSIEAGLKSPTQ